MRHASDLQALDAAGLTPQDRVVMAGIDIGQSPGHRIVLGDERGGEAAAVLAVAARIGVHASQQFDQRARPCAKRLQAGLKSGHQHGGRNAFPGYVSHRHQKRLAG
jgi:hypothetical protein